MTLTELKKELDKSKFRNIYIFTGEERELLLQYVGRVADGKPVKHVSSLKQAMTYARAGKLFSKEREVYVVEDDKTIINLKFAELMANAPKVDTIVIIMKDLDKRSNFYKDCSSQLVTFAKLKEAQLISLVERELGGCDKRLATVIVQYCGNDVCRIINECQKLVMCEDEITLDLVNDVVSPTVEDCIFAMIDAVAGKRRADVYEYYRDLLYLNEPPIKILSILYTKLKQVFIVQHNYQLPVPEIAEKTGLTPFQIHQAKGFISAFSPDVLIKHVKATQDAEVQIKTGKIDQFLALENLLIDILK